MNRSLTGISRVLLSGASGMLGAVLSQALTEAGCTVCRLVRRPPTTINEIAWNPAAAQPFDQPHALEGFDAAIHLGGANLAAHRWSPAYKAELLASRVDSTHALATALAALESPPETLLTASAIGIYGDRGAEVLDESFPSGFGFLSDLCRHWEAAAQPAIEGRIRVAHLRTGLVLAPREGALAKLLPLFRLGLGGRLGSGQQWMSWIAVDDWVRAVLFLLEEQNLAGPVNLTSPQPVTNAEFSSVLGRVLHRPALLPAPAFALRLALGEMAGETLLASQRALPQKLLDSGFKFATPALEEALRAMVG